MTGSGPSEAWTGPQEPIDPEDWRAYRREMWRRRRADRRAGRNSRGEWHGPPWPFFGCMFALAFLVIAWAVVTLIATAFSQLGPIPVLIAALVVLVVLFGSSGPFRRSARVLDSIVEATRRVEGGDYTTRVSTPSRAWRPITCRQSLARSEYLAGYFYERTRHNCRAAAFRYEGLAGRLSGLRECRRGTVSLIGLSLHDWLRARGSTSPVASHRGVPQQPLRGRSQALLQ